MQIELPSNAAAGITAIPGPFQKALLPVARRVFWWGKPEEWMDDVSRFTAQVMVFGDWNDTALTWKLLGDSWFREVLTHAPPGLFDLKSWAYWHHRYQMDVPPLPVRF